jgi:hypothetical protein
MSEEYKIEMEPETSAGELSDKHVDATENMMELEFTDEFLAFLENHNGGVPVRRYFRLGANVKIVEQFLCLVENYRDDEYFGQFDIGVVWSQIEDRLSEFHLPFAAVYPGDFLCFDFEEFDDPTVVLWVHDRSGEDEPFTEPVAANFKEFLSMLSDNDGSR